MRNPFYPKTFRAHLPACSGFTLFELLAVLTVISIGLMVIVGAYGPWSTIHALDGAARTLEAGVQQARSLAMTRREAPTAIPMAQRAYVAFKYGSETTNGMKTVTSFQPYHCRTTDPSEPIEYVLQGLFSTYQSELPNTPDLEITPAAPSQRLSGHVRFAYIPENNLSSVFNSTPFSLSQSYPDMTLFFRPDGSVLGFPDDKQAHYILIYTQEYFSRGGNMAKPLCRILRIDLATGFVTVIKPEVTP